MSGLSPKGAIFHFRCWKKIRPKLHSRRKPKKKLSCTTFKTRLTLDYTGWLIGILIMAYCNPYITGLHFIPNIYTASPGSTGFCSADKEQISSAVKFHVASALIMVGRLEITSQKSNIDTQNDGLQKVDSFKKWQVLVSIR